MQPHTEVPRNLACIRQVIRHAAIAHASRVDREASICGATSRAMATIALESTPPDRNAPTGTSATIWRWTAVRSDCSTRRAASSANVDRFRRPGRRCPRPLADDAAVLDAESLAGTEPPNTPDRRRSPRAPEVSQHAKERGDVECPGDRPVHISAFSSLANRNPSAVWAKYRGFTAIASSEQQRPGRIVPDGKREDAVERREHRLALRFVKGEENLSIRLTAEEVPLCSRPAPELPKVVNLAVEHDDGGSCPVVHRLMTKRRDVDDRQTTVRESDLRARRMPFARVIGTAVDSAS